MRRRGGTHTPRCLLLPAVLLPLKPPLPLLTLLVVSLLSPRPALVGFC